jgi:purine nucleosidase
MRSFWIDTDTASDDAVAILMALRWHDVRVEGISVVAGNVPVDRGVTNAIYTAELCRSDVPVHRGAERPLRREPFTGQFFHGPDGMGGMDYRARRGPASRDAVGALIRAYREARGELTLVTLGPLTNVALALEREPELASRVPRCFVMGGAACTMGNITPAAEFNIWCDPEAARTVFRSGMPITMVGWEHCRGAANLDDADMARLRQLGTPFSTFTLDCNRTATKVNREWLGEPGMGLPDPVTMAIALDPAVCTRRSTHYVEIACDDELTRGMTVVDGRNVAKVEPNPAAWRGVIDRPPAVDVCWAIDVARWKSTLYHALE